MTEMRRNLIRIASNFAKLLATLILAYYWTPLILQSVQENAFGLVAFLGANVGLADRIRGIINRSMVRELGVAHHSNDPRDFPVAINCAVVACLGAGVLTILLHGILIALLPLFPVKTEGLLSAAYWFVIAKAIEAFFIVVMAPIFNFYLIDERMPTYNFWLVAIRAANVMAAGSMLLFFPLSNSPSNSDIANNVIIYGFLSAALATLMMAIPVFYLILTDNRFRPHLSLVNWPGVKKIVAVGGWNAGLMAATSTFIPVTGAFMFWNVGALGGRIFGFAMPLTYYVRMLATGMAAGLDAVSTRVTSGKSNASLKQIIIQSARLNGFVIFPAMAFIVTLAEPIFEVWVGHLINDPHEITMAANLVYALSLSAISMSIAEAWITIIYGAGYIQRIVPMILIGLGVFLVSTPIAIWLTPASWDYLVPAIICSAIVFLTMFLGIAIVIARILEITTLEVVAPLARTFISAIVMLPILFAFQAYIEQWSLRILIVAMLLYGGAFSIMSWFYVLTSDERSKILSFIRTNCSRQKAT